MTGSPMRSPTAPVVSSVFNKMLDVVAEVAPELHELLERENLLGLAGELENARDASYEGNGQAHAAEFLLLAAQLTTLVAKIGALAGAESVPFFAEDPEARRRFMASAVETQDDDYDLREHGYNFIAGQLVEFAEILTASAGADFDFAKAPSA
ncbi:MAG: hypothetical protein AAB692_00400 [Patescibacteria group bacterium]